MAMADPVRITFLGGLGDIGRNCAAIECRGELLLLDCGVLFADENMPGADFVLPDLEYLSTIGPIASWAACAPTATRTTSGR